MTWLVLLVSFLFATSLDARAGEFGTIVQLGTVTPATRAQWRDGGFDVAAVDCKDAPCIINALAGRANPIYVVASAPQAAIVRDLYAGGIRNDDIAGVVLLRARDDGTRPITAGPDAPPILIMAELGDPKDVVVASREFATALRNQGVRSEFIVVADIMTPDGSLQRMTADVVLYFAGHSPFGEDFNLMMKAYEVWEKPPFNNQEFLADPALLHTYPMDDVLKRMVEFHYKYQPPLAKQWRLDTYVAFDLMAYRDKVAPGARYVSLRNRLQQLIFLDLDVYAPYDPAIVVGIDDVTNLYELVWFYRTQAMYSWTPDPPQVSARLFGPVLHFRKPVPDALGMSLLLRSALTLDGITFFATDPLAPIAAYSENIRNVITNENNCINCHAIGDLGGRAQHINALTGEAQGGFGLPLADYSDEVMKAFLYDQTTVANKIGMIPNPVKGGAVDEFYAWYKTLVKEAQTTRN